jgi:hypothetical protein
MRTLFAYGVVVTLLLVVGRVRLLPKWGSSAMRAIQGDWLAYDFRFSFVRHLLKAVRLFVYSLVTLTAIGLLFSTPETGLSSFDTFVAGVVAVVTTYQYRPRSSRGTSARWRSWTGRGRTTCVEPTPSP